MTIKFMMTGFALVTIAASTVLAQDSVGEPGRGDRGSNPLNNVYFGEQHLHTSSSADAFAFGTRTGPDDAYRFAKGEPITLATTGEAVQKSTPYDWAAVTDHAVYFGVMPMLLDPDSPMKDTEVGKMIAAGQGEAAFQMLFTSVAVNVVDASYTNSIGDNELSAVWTDPDFDRTRHSVYYVRVIEIPTPRWSTYDAAALGIAPGRRQSGTRRMRAT
jgi:hypothetical protein